MKIIPAIDIIGGKCVRLTKGDYATQKTYRDDPVEVAKEFEAAGLQYLHLVDLDGARSNRIINYKTLNAIASQTGLVIDFGGGIKSTADLAIAFDNGAHQATAGSIAVQEPETVYSWLETYGPFKIIIGADCIGRKVATSGWMAVSDANVIDFIGHFAACGASEFVCTDISKDGMLLGPSVALYKEIMASTGVNLTASGGIRSADDIMLLKAMGCRGAIIGKAIYEGKIKLKELQELC